MSDTKYSSHLIPENKQMSRYLVNGEVLLWTAKIADLEWHLDGV